MRVYCSNCERSVDSTNAEGQCPSCAGDDINFSPAFMARWEKAEWRRTAREGLAAVRCSCGDLIGYMTEQAGLSQMGALCGNCAVTTDLAELRTLLAGAASLLKDKLTPDTGQLRTQWDRDVDEWMVAAAPLFQEADE